MTVYEKGHQWKDWLTVQASLPKIVFGHNAALPSERQAQEAASSLCDHVASQTGLIFTLEDTKAFRVDYTRDYQIQEERAREIALALVPKEIPDFLHANLYGNTVSFAKSRGSQTIKKIVVYPKFAWANDTDQPPNVVEHSRGKLRLEVRLMRRGLAEIKGATRPLDFLSQSISDSRLNEAAKMLDLERIIDARGKDLHQIIIVHHRGQRSLGKGGLSTFIELVKRYGENFYQKPDFYYPRSTYYQRKKECERLGLWGDVVAASEVHSA